MADEFKAEVVVAKPALTEQEGARLRLREIADDILQKNLQIMGDAASFRDIDIDTEVCPAEWVREMGVLEAEKRLRLAKASWLPAKDAPVGLANARAIVVGMLKSKAMENAAPRTLNVTAVMMTEPQIRKVLADEFPVLDVD